MIRDTVSLRPVVDDDIVLFYEHQRDPASTEVAGFPARSRQDHERHWQHIRRRADVIARTVMRGERVVGNIASWTQDERRHVGYWIDRAHWGQGVATRALQLLLGIPGVTRPVWAHVAAHNTGSIRVLEKCGFVNNDADVVADDEVESILM